MHVKNKRSFSKSSIEDFHIMHGKLLKMNFILNQTFLRKPWFGLHIRLCNLKLTSTMVQQQHTENENRKGK